MEAAPTHRRASGSEHRIRQWQELPPRHPRTRAGRSSTPTGGEPTATVRTCPRDDATPSTPDSYTTQKTSTPSATHTAPPPADQPPSRPTPSATARECPTPGPSPDDTTPYPATAEAPSCPTATAFEPATPRQAQPCSDDAAAPRASEEDRNQPSGCDPQTCRHCEMAGAGCSRVLSARDSLAPPGWGAGGPTLAASRAANR